ncbi:phosphatase PAP2 family protein [Caulobacter segnis]|uniref:Acid phosphatase n=2 Tax=Caulobacter segnis TaxID=88688 RepID=D5VPD4_CAUST|nr:phosphatase PAP2 family protein [Caulobacter segnis]ADG12357.1 Acid phosphatase [Caulobacter segnis ATCC 21756]AVQ03945.1 phosphatase PAP2 family protein [Caulobacter segnis]
MPRFVLIAATVILASCARFEAPAGSGPVATTPPSAGWTKPPPGYLAGNSGIDATAIIGPPPAPNSPRGKAERAQFEETRKLVNTPAWSQAVADADLSGKNGLKSFSCAAGVTLSAEATPTLASLLLRMTDDAAKIYQPAKAAYRRPRPPVGNAKPICVPREPWIETDGSYPSGHGLIGWAWASVIAELVPEKASPILARGKAFGDSRIICGVHFQSDVEAGRYLGSALVTRLHDDPAFMADMAKARAEVAASKANGAPTGCAS